MPENHKFLSSRKFLVDDQVWFSEVSGDYNLLHTDVLEARKTSFGRPVVHGIHLLLWGIEQYANKFNTKSISGIHARFRNALRIDEEVSVSVEDLGDHTTLRFYNDHKEFTSAKLSLGSEVPVCNSENFSRSIPKKEIPDLLEIEAMQNRTGRVKLHYPNHLQDTFAATEQILSAVSIAELLATTFVVGMKCPGHYSLYNELKVLFSPAERTAPSVLNYTVKDVRPHFRRVRINLEGTTLSGHLDASVRLQPQQQASLLQVQADVKSQCLAGRRVLVVGGSRGLGELATKISVSAGADVCLTFYKGEIEAQLICDQIEKSDGSCAIIQLDITDLSEDALAPLRMFDPDLIFFFSTPTIEIQPSRSFDSALSEKFNNHYVSGFAHLVETLVDKRDHQLDVVVPSTVYIENPIPGSAEYVASKTAAEAVALNLQGKHAPLRAHIWRLPKVLTDQTASLTDHGAVDGKDLLINLISETFEPF